MAVEQKPVIDPRTGDILVHGRSGMLCACAFQDAAGVARDVSAAALYFEIDGILRLALEAGATTDERLIRLTRAQVVSCAAGPKFALVEETSPTNPQVLWSGRIRVAGFTVQPA